MVVVLQRGGVLRTLHVGRAATVRGGARAARAHSGRDVTPTQRARHSPRPFARTVPGQFYDSPLYLPLWLLRFIYLRSEAKQRDFGGKYRTVQRTHPMNWCDD